MQLFWMDAMKYSTSPLYFLGLTLILKASMYSKTSDKWNIPWYNRTEHCITVLCHAIENTVENTINATYARRMMGRLDGIASNMQQLSCILIGCIFYGVA